MDQLLKVASIWNKSPSLVPTRNDHVVSNWRSKPEANSYQSQEVHMASGTQNRSGLPLLWIYRRESVQSLLVESCRGLYYL